MQDFVVQVHSIFRWVVLLTALAALVFSIMAATGSRGWDALSNRFSLLFTIAMDIQLLIGLILWVVEQRWSAGDPVLSFLHPILMIGAVALAHIGRARAEREQTAKARGTTSAIFFGASLVIVLAAIPIASWPL